MIPGFERRKINLEDLRARIPETHCKGLCVEQCSIVPVFPVEREAIEAVGGKVVELAGMAVLASKDMQCVHLVDARCYIYEERPLLCRLYGAVEGMPCPHGCGPTFGVISDADAAETLSKASGGGEMRTGQDGGVCRLTRPLH